MFINLHKLPMRQIPLLSQITSEANKLREVNALPMVIQLVNGRNTFEPSHSGSRICASLCMSRGKVKGFTPFS